MHETLEMKEEEIAQLRSRLQQTTSKKEELQDQKEKAEKLGEWNPTLLICSKNIFSKYVLMSCCFSPTKHLKNLNEHWV